MKRWTLRICVFLLIGAIVNIVVAWACALWPRQPALSKDIAYFRSSQTTPCWIMEEFRSSGATRVVWLPFGGFGGSPGTELGFALNEATSSPKAAPPNWSVVDWQQGPTWTGPFGLVIETACGWPFASLASFAEFGWNERSTGFVPWFALVRGEPEIEEAETAQLVPLRPIFPGFAINTVFYAGILWLLFAAPFALRRRFQGGRRKRGLCPACGYQVGTSAVCTECGKPVTPKVTVGEQT